MKEIRLTREFLRRPVNSLIILLSIYLFIEAVSWSIGFQIKLTDLNQQGGLLNYASYVIRAMLIPEFCTLFIIIFLINRWHEWFKIEVVTYNWRSIGRYELRFLPVLVFAFWLFDPITQTIRFLLEKFPNYSLDVYKKEYIFGTLTWSMYFIYFLPVLLIGYIALNISLLSDYLKQRREAQELAEAEAARASQEALALYATFTPKPAPTTPSPYLTYLKGKNALGELDFPVNDAYYFTIEDRFYYAELVKGRYLVSKTLNELEAELDPTQFFRIKRDYIVNRQAVLNYAYWENGKYIVRLNTPDQYNIVVPRARMQEFREWLQGRYIDTPEHANTALL
ncbi:LytTR family DNA-binding domain-containing protein [Spirosoma validum]|uniref:LytTR family transcriptional regulator DNA-binding domain-containing protein n=1 Tax=Spirosoma validum TaxID=2771355 RepID=A0A927B5V9_9BACT|nr:LytTR family DNA-binding domain-containing protein [Spirosoma validum]MBD2756244.1 LytTR family transcriptional regulator DNA-binding domain-containing protein [Spirosoma validum]